MARRPLKVKSSPESVGMLPDHRSGSRHSNHLKSDFFIVARPIPVAPNVLPT
jgi:hypothetical protein